MTQGETFFKNKGYNLIMLFTFWKNWASYFIRKAVIFLLPKTWVVLNPATSIIVVQTSAEWGSFLGEEKKHLVVFFSIIMFL